jgi:peptide deformylase
MKLFKIYTVDDTVLHQKAEEVALPISDEIRQTLKDMVEYLKLSQDDEFAKEHNIRPGIGIAAPQIGISKRFFAVYMDDGDKHYEYGLVNPKILSTSVKKAYLAGGEGCLSVPKDAKGYVYRYYKVTMEAYDVLSEKMVKLRLVGYPAICFQHEYDHLDGVLYIDRIDKKEPFHVDPDAVVLE